MSKKSSELTSAKSYFQGTIYNDLLQMGDTSNLREVINSIDKFVDSEGRGITTSQLRNIYSKVLGVNEYLQLQLLRPVLAYTAARQGTQGAKIIIALLDDLIQQVDSDAKLQSFQTFTESLVGYHKFHHGKS